MPMYRSFIADKNNPRYAWDNTDTKRHNTGNTPSKLVPREFHLDLGFGHQWYEKQVASGEFPGRQLDWGAWAVAVAKADCLRIWDGCQAWTQSKDWQAIKEQIEALPDEGQYLIVVMEMP